MIRSIAHATDFSPEGHEAFAHALKLALNHRCELGILYVRDPSGQPGWDMFPRVRELLERWGVLPVGSAIEDIAAKTGVDVFKAEIRDTDPADGLSHFLNDRGSDLIVMASHGRTGLNRWMTGSVSDEVAHKLRIPVLLFGPKAAPFVDPATGAMSLQRVLVPVAHEPSPLGAIAALDRLTEGLGVELDFIHAGPDMPHLHLQNGAAVAVRQVLGDPADAILAEAAGAAQLIAMPTAGRHGILDAIRGSTIERVLHAAPCPVLAFRVGGWD